MASKRDEAKFLRGETGVDGAAVKEEVDLEVAEQLKAKEALLRGRTWLGRECLTWLLWRSESTEPVTTLDGADVSVVFNGRLVLRAGQGDVTELTVKGVTSPYAREVKAAIGRGLLVHGAKLQVTWGEQVFDVSLDAEHFDAKSAKLPALLQEDEAEKLIERLDLAGKLSALVNAIIEAFVAVRLARAWEAKVVPELLAWAREPAATAPMPRGRAAAPPRVTSAANGQGLPDRPSKAPPKGTGEASAARASSKRLERPARARSSEAKAPERGRRSAGAGEVH